MNKGSWIRKAAVATVATLTAFAGLAPFAPSASAAANYTQTRYSGTDRFDTAARIAAAIAQATPTAVLARADIYPDALTGAFAAAANGDGPLLLTRSDSVPSRTLDALQDEGVDRVILLGGTAAISGSVETQLRNAGYNVDRIFGATRYQTAIEIAEDGSGIIGTIDGDRAALISSGENFPDALAGAPLSFAAGLPSLLVHSNLDTPTKVAVFNQVVDALRQLQITDVYLLGGPAAVSQSVEDSLRDEGFGTTRLAGGNRSATSVEVFTFGMDKGIYTNRRFGLARGDTFPDALAYAPLGGRPRATVAPQSGVADTGGSSNGLLLAASHCTLSDAVEDFILENQASWTQGEILGGPAAICETVAQQVEDAASFGRAAITLDTQQAEPGGTITGNVQGENIASVTVSGCGLNQPVTRDAEGDFSLTIPTTQTTDCTLTFTTTFTDGSSEVDQFPIDIIAPGDPNVTLNPSSGPSGTTVTATYTGNRPGNITGVSSPNCTITNQGSQANNRTFTISGTEGQQCTVVTTVQFTDTQGGTGTFTDIFTIGTGTTDFRTQGVGAGPQLRTAGPDLLTTTIINGAPNDGTANQVRFTYDEAVQSPGVNCGNVGSNPGGTSGGTPTTPATGVGCAFSIQGADSDNVLAATSATVDPADANSVIAGFSDTIDLRTFTIGTSDEGAVTDGENLSVMASKPLGGTVTTTTTGRTAGPDLISATPNSTFQEVTYCFDEPINNALIQATQLGYYTGGGAESRGDSFTSRAGTQNCVTVQFGGPEPDATANADQPVEAGHRFFAEDQTPGNGDAAVRGATSGFDNPIGHEPQSATTVRPDLTSANRVTPPTGNPPTQVDFTFDEPVTAGSANATQFAVYLQDGGQRFDGDVAQQNGSNTIRVTFDELNVNNVGNIVLAGVEEDAVFSAASATGNTVGDAAMPGGSGTSPGFTDGPDLIGATYTASSNQVTFHFDEAVQGIVPGAFFIVNAIGTETCGTGTATVSGATATVTFPSGVAAAWGAGVNSDTDGENACTMGHGAFDSAGNGNSPDSVGGGPASTTT